MLKANFLENARISLSKFACLVSYWATRIPAYMGNTTKEVDHASNRHVKSHGHLNIYKDTSTIKVLE